MVCCLTVPKEYTELKVHFRYLQIFQMCVCLDLLFIYGPDVSISQIPDNSGKYWLKNYPLKHNVRLAQQF